jgi:hypothetical protein
MQHGLNKLSATEGFNRAADENGANGSGSI